MPAPPTRIAVAEGRIWVGTERGLYRLAAPRPLQPAGPAALEVVWLGPAVLDLAPAPGELWIASSRGLARWTPADGVALEPPLAPGADVRGVAWAQGRLYVATAVGLFVGSSGGFARDGSLPPGAIDAVRAERGEVFAARRGSIFALQADGRFAPCLRAQPPGWWELLAVLPGPTLVVPGGVWNAAEHPPRRIAGLRPPLRGAAAIPGVRAALSDSELSALGPEPQPLPIRELAGADLVDVAALDEDSLALLTRGGVLQIRLGPASSPATAPASGTQPPLAVPLATRLATLPDDALDAPPPAAPPLEDVSIAALHAAVLAYLELEPGRMLGLEQRFRRSLWLPQLRLSSALDQDHTRSREQSQVFNTGSVRDLRDGASERQGTGSMELQFVWDFAARADPRPLLEVSRERRELIELRDQVLERVDRLYFERLRARSRAAQLPGDAAERTELWIRDREITAQLDAWSGGAFSQLVARFPHSGESAPP